jgi:hypothetical protein
MIICKLCTNEVEPHKFICEPCLKKKRDEFKKARLDKEKKYLQCKVIFDSVFYSTNLYPDSGKSFCHCCGEYKQYCEFGYKDIGHNGQRQNNVCKECDKK